MTYLGDDLLVLTEERQQALVVVQVPNLAGPLRRADARSITLALNERTTPVSKASVTTERAIVCSWSGAFAAQAL